MKGVMEPAKLPIHVLVWFVQQGTGIVSCAELDYR